MLNTITWNGIASDSFTTTGARLFIKKSPTLSRARRKYTKYSVPGRNGDIIIPQDAFENYSQEYELFLYTAGGTQALSTLARRIADWLYQPGYCNLIDSIESGYYRKAFFSGPMDVENHLLQFGSAKIKFDCAPKRYLIEDVITVTGQESYTAVNDTAYVAEPVIVANTYKGNTRYPKLKIALTYEGTTKQWVYTVQEGVNSLKIDSESRTFDAGTVPFAGKNVIGASEFPKLRPGSTVIKVVGLDANGDELQSNQYPDWTLDMGRWVL